MTDTNPAALAWERVEEIAKTAALHDGLADEMERKATELRNHAQCVGLVHAVASLEAAEIEETGQRFPVGTTIETLAWPEEAFGGEFDVSLTSVVFPDGDERDRISSDSLDSFVVGYFAPVVNDDIPKTIWDDFAVDPDADANHLVIDVEKVHAWAVANECDWRAAPTEQEN